MKFLIVFALALSSASAFSMANSKLGITNGKNAADGQFPHQVAIHINTINDQEVWCDGSLIGHQWVLTTAHCSDYAHKYFTVYLGVTNRKEPEIKHTVTEDKVIFHPKYKWPNYNNDIALIEIPSTPNTNKIRPAKLPAISSSYSTYAGEDVIASGWGAISEKPIVYPKVLQFAGLKVITNDECAKTYSDLIDSSTICVSATGGVATCFNDEGSPLVLKTKNSEAYTLIGVSSLYPIDGCTSGNPSIFARVTDCLDWIKETTGISY